MSLSVRFFAVSRSLVVGICCAAIAAGCSNQAIAPPTSASSTMGQNRAAPSTLAAPSDPSGSAANGSLAPFGELSFDATGAQVYISAINGQDTAGEIFVYDASLKNNPPKQIGTRNVKSGFIPLGLATNTAGTLYAALATSGGNCPCRIEVFPHGGNRGSSPYVEASGFFGRYIAVASDGTIYLAGWANSFTTPAIEVFKPGHRQPVQTLNVTGTALTMGVSTDAANDLWVIVQVKAKSQYLLEFPPGSPSGTMYQLPNFWCCTNGGIAFDPAGHVLVGACEGSMCGAAVLSLPSLQQAGFIQVPARYGSGFTELALTPNGRQLWGAVYGPVFGLSYPGGALKVAFTPSKSQYPYVLGLAIGIKRVR